MLLRQKKNPLDIACGIKEVLQDRLKDDARRIEIIKPGFVHVFISQKGLLDSLNKIIKQKDKLFKEKRKKKVLLEFVSANPTGPLSIAHGRQAVVGDVLGRALEFLGNQVTREYYINDAGRQINLLEDSVKYQMRRSLRVKDFADSLSLRVEDLLRPEEGNEIPQDGYHGSYVEEIALEAVRKVSADKDVKDFDLKQFILNYVLSGIKKDLSSLGIGFNNWISQQKIIDDGKVEQAVKVLKNKGLIYEEGGALWFKATAFGDDKDRVIKKADSELTYFASDIAYHRDKFERKFDLFINLWGPDHHGYVKRVKSAVKALGFNDALLDVIIIQLVTINTKERMSRRKGTAILLSDLIKEVGRDASRFYYLQRKNFSPLEFDIDLAKTASFDNPLYYIQYAHTRILSIFRKAKVKEFFPEHSSLLEEEELNLIRDILQFFSCLDKVYYNLEPVFLIEYLKGIAASFHKFYEKRRILSDDKNKTLAGLNLLEAVRVVIDCGLRILGIEPLEEM